MHRSWWAVVIALTIILVIPSCRQSELPGSPAPVPSPREIQEGLVIASHSTYADSAGHFRVIGEVKNVGSQSTKSNRVTVTFLDSQGVATLAGSNDCYLEVLRPGEKSPFEIVFPSAPTSANYKLTTAWRLTKDEPYRGIVVQDALAKKDEAGSYWVTGKVMNTGLKAVRIVAVAGSFYDNLGKIVAVGYTFCDKVSLQPGEISTFTMVIDSKVATAIHTYSFQAEGYE